MRILKSDKTVLENRRQSLYEKIDKYADEIISTLEITQGKNASEDLDNLFSIFSYIIFNYDLTKKGDDRTQAILASFQSFDLSLNQVQELTQLTMLSECLNHKKLDNHSGLILLDKLCDKINIESTIRIFKYQNRELSLLDVNCGRSIFCHPYYTMNTYKELKGTKDWTYVNNEEFIEHTFEISQDLPSRTLKTDDYEEYTARNFAKPEKSKQVDFELTDTHIC